jgi:hypothetical protein
MNIWCKILNNIEGKIKIFLSFALMCFLSSCGDCDTVQDYMDDGTGANCFFCPLYITLSNAGSAAANTSWRIVASAAQPVVCIAIAIFIAFNTLKTVASMGQQSFADYISAEKKGILILTFKAAVIVLLLTPENFMAKSVIAPLLEAAANIGIGLADSMITLDVSAPKLNGESSPWDGLFGLMNDIARGFNDVAYMIVAIGKALICHSTDGFPILGWDGFMLVYGLILLLFGWMVCIGVCYFLVDVIINLICAAVLLPLAIALAISEKTKSHTKNIWNLFVNSFCSCIFLGTVLALAIAIIDVNMGDGAIDYLIAGNNVSALNSHLENNGSLLLMIVSLTLLVKVIESIKDLAKKLSNAKGVTYAGSKTMTPITQKAMGEGMRLAKGAGKSVGHVAVRAAHLDELATWGKNRVNAGVGFVTGAGPQGYNAFWRPGGRALAKKTFKNIGSAVGFMTGLGPQGHKAFWRRRP